MGSEWRTSSWGEEISLEYGKTLKDYRDGIGKYQVFGSNGPVGWTDEKLADGPGVILGRKGAYRGVRYSPDAFFVIDTAYYVQPKSTFDMRWLYYAILHYKLGDIDDGSPIPSTTRAAVYVTEFEIPPLPEQRAIAHILGSLDDKIELNRRMNVTLEGMAQALFKSWFVDFDPVIDNALVGGNPIPEELADRAEVRRAALANGTANREAAKQFPAGFQQTEELGWIPEGWEIAEMTEVAYLNPEAWSSTNHPDRVSYIDLGNVKDGRIDEVIEYDFEVAPSRARRVLREDDTVIGTVRPGNRSFAYIHESNLTGSTGFAVLRPKHPKSRAFVYFCLTQDEVIGYFAHLADGGAYPAIRPDVVGNFLTPLCNSELIETFDQHCYPMIQKIGRNQRQALSLTKLRDTLLPKLISGELRIPDAEKLAEAALA
jgi:type I restriction enzyme S subunit